MNVLAIETAASVLGVALVSDDGTAASYVANGARRHVELLAPAIAAVLELAGVDRAELDGVAVDIGPGLFTGLRAGVAAAKGLSLSLGIPAVGIHSTAVLRAQAEIFEGAVVASLDVRRGEIAFEFPGDQTPCIGSIDVVLERVERLAEIGPVLLVGNGFEQHRDAIAARFGRVVRIAGEGYLEPSADVLGRLGRMLLSAGHGRSAAALEVDYLRAADVAITWTTRSSEVH